MTLVDPCPTTALTINQPASFVDQIYNLRGDPIDRVWDIETILTRATAVDCGPVSVEFFNVDTNAMPISSLFEDNRSTPNAYNFKSLYTEDLGLKSTYPIKLTAYLTNYPTNRQTSAQPFIITIVDPCDAPTDITASNLANQEYTITASASTYAFDAFIVQPVWCDIEYTYEIVTTIADSSVVALDADPLVREFTFAYDSSLEMAGAASQDYIVKVTGKSGIVDVIVTETSFTLTLKNPCIDPNFVALNNAALPAGEEYTLHSLQASGGYSFTHDAFFVDTLPFTHTLCGGLTYKATFNGGPIDTTTKPPMAYDTASRTFTIYSEDFSLLGDRMISVEAYLTDYPTTTTTAPEIETILIKNPCDDPFSLTATVQTNPGPYEYSSVAIPSFEFALDPYSVDPDASVCPITYSCASSGPAGVDVCATADGAASFDPQTGNFSFNTVDMATYPEGDYTFTITGAVGAKSVTETFVMTLVDPCPTTALTVNQPAALTTGSYSLREDRIERLWDIDTILGKDTLVDCGPVTVEFIDTNTGAAPDTDLFLDDRTTAGAFSFASLYSETVGKKGDYPIQVRAYHTNYDTNVATLSTPFVISVVDRCDAVDGLTAPTLTDQEYTITASAKQYQIAVFTPDPAWCDVQYSYRIVTPIADDSVVGFNEDQLVRQFTFAYDASLDMSGLASKTYEVEVKGASGQSTVVEATATFTLTLKNPCIDPNFVALNNAALPAGEEYTLHSLQASGGYSFTHDAFFVDTLPFTHTLCGGLTYKATFNGGPIDTTTKPPMAYDTASRTFTIYSEDFSLLGDRMISVEAYLTDYPTTTTTAPEIETILIKNPCDDPFSLTATVQTNPGPYEYSSVAIPSFEFALDPYSVDPDASVCPITYSCASSGPAGVDVCATADGAASFDPQTGNFSFNTVDMATYPEGDYTFTITGAVGAKSVTETFVMTLVDPCPTTALTVNQPAAFTDNTYSLRQDRIERLWDITTILTQTTLVDCGPVTVKFIDTNTGLAPDSRLFADDRSTPGAFSFASIYAEDKALKGQYPIQVEVYHTNYATDNNIASLPAPFVISVIDECDSGASITASTLIDQDYTITDAARPYQIDAFIPSPAWCDITYTYTVATAVADPSVLTFNPDQLVREFTFFYDSSLAMAGAASLDYVIEVVGEVGVATKQQAAASFTLTLKNPCIDPAFVTIEQAVLLNQVYELYEFDPIGFQFTHDPFVVKTVPITHTLCGDLVYTSTFMGAPISPTLDPLADPSVDPVGYDSSSRTHTVYSEDVTLFGLQPYTVNAAFVEYPGVTSAAPDAQALIEFLDPCPDPEAVNFVLQTNPPDYYYTAQSPAMVFTLAPYQVEPPICAFTYSCAMTGGPRTDLCAIADGDTHGVFDPITGDYTFYSTDLANYPAGQYTFEITGTVGNKSAKTTIVMTLVDPCPTTALTINQPPSFVDDQYLLRGNQIDRTWDIDSIVSLGTQVDCGPLTVEFFDVNTGVTPDSDIFKDDRTIPGAFSFQSLYTEAIGKKGEYPIKFRAFHTNYAADNNVVTLATPFIVSVVDPCDAPQSLAPSTLADQEYTITASAGTYVFDPFTPSPAWCDITYTYTVATAIADPSILTFNPDQLVREFTFVYDLSLEMAGAASQDYIVKVTGKSGIVDVIVTETSFTLTLKNPCIDPNFVALNNAALPAGEEYTLHSLQASGGYSFTHDAFFVDTLPFTHTLCGGLTYKATFNGGPIDTTTKPPMAYDTASRTFTIYSEDFSLLGDRMISVEAYLTDYPTTTTTAPEIETILIKNPCDDPFSLTATVQTNPGPYEYSSVAIPSFEFALDPYSVDPDASVCPITYSCASSGPAGVDVCATADGAASFDPQTGNFSFNTVDMATYPEGDYTFTITGAVGAKSVTETFVMTLVDPCPTTALTVNQPAAFTDGEYVLRANLIERVWDIDSLVSRATLVDCGPLTVEFFDVNTGFAPDADIFKDDRTTLGAFSFQSLYTEAEVKKGDYPIQIRALHTNYAADNNVVTLATPFVVTVVDPCDSRVTIVPSTLVDQEYTITASAGTYVFDPFTPSPAWCDITYTYTVATAIADPSILTFNPDQLVREFTFVYDLSLEMAGAASQDYVISVSGQVGNVDTQLASATFTLTLKNPCIDPAFVTIQSTTLPTGLEYSLFRFGDVGGFAFTHDAFSIQTSPIAHTLCGSLDYMATFEGVSIDSASSLPMAYISATRTFTVYSEEVALLGPRQFSVTAYFADYRGTSNQPTVTETIIIKDGCDSPVSLQAPTQTNAAPYEYKTFDRVAYVQELVPFVGVPGADICPITYSCASSGPAGVDVCATADGAASFDPQTGNFSFNTVDMATYPEGDYTFTITGTVGAKSVTETFVMTVVDPCPTTALTINQPADFADGEYVLRGNLIDRAWDIDAIVSKATLVDCGPLTIEFYDDNTGTTPDTVVFADDRTTPGTFSFQSLYTETVAKKGDYPIKFRAFHTNYAADNNVVTLATPFVITVIDPCENDASITMVNLQNQIYTITTAALPYQIPQFVVSPVWCDITYSNTVTDAAGSAAVTFDSDQTVRTFTFEYLGSLDLSGTSEKVYTVTVTGQAGYGAVASDEASFLLTVKNPCQNPALVSITTVPLQDEAYILFEYPGTGYTFGHDAFSVVTQPFQHSLCGDITYLATFMSQSITAVTSPMRYESPSRQFTIYSETFSLIGTQQITVRAHLSDYPTIETPPPDQNASIQIIDPCIDPDGIIATPQSDEDPYLYSLEPWKHRINRFVSVPTGCPITYSCLSVSGPSALSCETAGVTTFNGLTWTFQSDLIGTFVPGEYTVTIEGTTGSNTVVSDQTTFKMVVLDPCPYVSLSFRSSPFTDFTYTLRDPAKNQSVHLPDVVRIDTLLDCGPFAMLVYNFDELRSPLNETLFSYGADPSRPDDPQSSQFSVLYNANEATVGEYRFSALVYLESFPDRRRETFGAFKVSVIDPCNEDVVTTNKPDWCPVVEVALPEVIIDSGIVVEEEPQMPQWMEQLKTQRIRVGGEADLEYFMGEPVNTDGEPIDVSLSGGLADLFVRHNATSNVLRVRQDDLDAELAGTYRIVVTSTYETEASQVKFKEDFLIIVLPEPPVFVTPEVEEPEEFVLVEQWNGRVERDKVAKAVPPSRDQPVPYIVELSSTGLLTIGWNDPMQPPEDAQEIPPALIAVQLETEPEGRRRLSDLEAGQDALFKTIDGSFEQKMHILNALEIRVLPQEGDDIEEIASIEFEYDLVDYDGDNLWLQFDFKDPQQVSRSLTDQHRLQITFWGTQYFKNIFDKEVAFGTQLTYPIVRQIDMETSASVDQVSEIADTVFIAVLIIFLLLALCAGPLLPTWMFFNSMQLLFHVPLIRSDLPAHAHFFMVDYLSKLRLHFAWSESMADDFLGSPARQDYEALVNADDSFYTSQFKESGYHHSVLSNLFVVLVLAALLLFVWLMALVKDAVSRGCSKGHRGRRCEPFVTNFQLRFFYEVVFEVILCALLYLVYWDVGNSTAGAAFAVSLIIVVSLALLVLFCGTLGCFKGPYVRGAYRKGTLLGSLWGVRPIDPEEPVLKRLRSIRSGFIAKGNKDNDPVEESIVIERPDSKLKANCILPIGLILDQNDDNNQNEPRIEPEDGRDSYVRKLSSIHSPIGSPRSPMEAQQDSLANASNQNRVDQSHPNPLLLSAENVPINVDTAAMARAVQSAQKSENVCLDIDRFETSREDSPEGKPVLRRELFRRSGSSFNPELGQDPKLEEERQSDFSHDLELNALPGGRTPTPGDEGFELREGGEATERDDLTTDRNLITKPQIDYSLPPVKARAKKLSDAFIRALAQEAYLRVALESHAHKAPRFKTLFYGLRKNHPRNVSALYPLLFVLRRLAFALILLFATQTPFLGVAFLLAACLGVLGLVLSETPWEDPLINLQHVVNEVVLYLVLLTVVVFVGLAPAGPSAVTLGWSLIGLLLGVIAFNVAVMIRYAMRHFRLSLLRGWARRHALSALLARNKSQAARSADKKLRQQQSMDVLPFNQDKETQRESDLMVHNIPIVIKEIKDEEKEAMQSSSNGISDSLSSEVHSSQIKSDKSRLDQLLLEAEKSQEELVKDTKLQREDSFQEIERLYCEVKSVSNKSECANTLVKGSPNAKALSENSLEAEQRVLSNNQYEERSSEHWSAFDFKSSEKTYDAKAFQAAPKSMISMQMSASTVTQGARVQSAWSHSLTKSSLKTGGTYVEGQRPFSGSSDIHRQNSGGFPPPESEKSIEVSHVLCGEVSPKEEQKYSEQGEPNRSQDRSAVMHAENLEQLPEEPSEFETSDSYSDVGEDKPKTSGADAAQPTQSRVPTQLIPGDTDKNPLSIPTISNGLSESGIDSFQSSIREIEKSCELAEHPVASTEEGDLDNFQVPAPIESASRQTQTTVYISEVKKVKEPQKLQSDASCQTLKEPQKVEPERESIAVQDQEAQIYTSPSMEGLDLSQEVTQQVIATNTTHISSKPKRLNTSSVKRKLKYQIQRKAIAWAETLRLSPSQHAPKSQDRLGSFLRKKSSLKQSPFKSSSRHGSQDRVSVKVIDYTLGGSPIAQGEKLAVSVVKENNERQVVGTIANTKENRSLFLREPSFSALRLQDQSKPNRTSVPSHIVSPYKTKEKPRSRVPCNPKTNKSAIALYQASSGRSSPNKQKRNRSLLTLKRNNSQKPVTGGPAILAQSSKFDSEALGSQLSSHPRANTVLNTVSPREEEKEVDPYAEIILKRQLEKQMSIQKIYGRKSPSARGRQGSIDMAKGGSRQESLPELQPFRSVQSQNQVRTDCMPLMQQTNNSNFMIQPKQMRLGLNSEYHMGLSVGENQSQSNLSNSKPFASYQQLRTVANQSRSRVNIGSKVRKSIEKSATKFQDSSREQREQSLHKKRWSIARALTHLEPKAQGSPKGRQKTQISPDGKTVQSRKHSLPRDKNKDLSYLVKTMPRQGKYQREQINQSTMLSMRTERNNLNAHGSKERGQTSMEKSLLFSTGRRNRCQEGECESVEDQPSPRHLVPGGSIQGLYSLQLIPEYSGQLAPQQQKQTTKPKTQHQFNMYREQQKQAESVYSWDRDTEQLEAQSQHEIRALKAGGGSLKVSDGSSSARGQSIERRRAETQLRIQKLKQANKISNTATCQKEKLMQGRHSSLVSEGFVTQRAQVVARQQTLFQEGQNFPDRVKELNTSTSSIVQSLVRSQTKKSVNDRRRRRDHDDHTVDETALFIRDLEQQREHATDEFEERMSRRQSTDDHIFFKHNKLLEYRLKKTKSVYNNKQSMPTLMRRKPSKVAAAAAVNDSVGEVPYLAQSAEGSMTRERDESPKVKAAKQFNF